MTFTLFKDVLLCIMCLFVIYQYIFPNGIHKYFPMSFYEWVKTIIRGELEWSLKKSGCDRAFLLVFKNGEKYKGGLPALKIRVFDESLSNYQIEPIDRLKDYKAIIFDDILSILKKQQVVALDVDDHKEGISPFYNSYRGLLDRDGKQGLYFAIYDYYGELIGVLCLEYIYQKMMFSMQGVDLNYKHYHKQLSNHLTNIRFMLLNQSHKLPKELQELRERKNTNIEYISIFFKNFLN